EGAADADQREVRENVRDVEAVRPDFERLELLVQQPLSFVIPLDGLVPELLRQSQLLIARRLSGADLVESVSRAGAVVGRIAEIQGLIGLGRGRSGCRYALVTRLCERTENGAMRFGEVIVVTAEVLRDDLPVDRINVALLTGDDFETSQFLA